MTYGEVCWTVFLMCASLCGIGGLCAIVWYIVETVDNVVWAECFLENLVYVGGREG